MSQAMLSNRNEPEWPNRTSGLDDLFPIPNNNRPSNRNNIPFGEGALGNFTGGVPRDSNHRSSIAESSRAASLINSWKITFTGLPSDIPVDKFLYMVNTLAKDTFPPNSSALTDHGYLLFSKDAHDWYWRFRRDNPNADWKAISFALRRHFNDHFSDSDIRDLIRDRKQKSNESFDPFYYDILKLCDRLSSSLTEAEFVDILRKNLKPDLRKELFFLDIKSVAQLRHLILRREKLNAELENFNKFSGKRVNSIEASETFAVIEPPLVDEIARKKKPSAPAICWNCRRENHSFRDCLENRTVFCYGCGEPNVYRPECQKCNPEN